MRELGLRLAAGLEALPHVVSVRGRGLMLACELDVPAPAVVRRALLSERLIVNATGPTTIRLLPPLIVSEAEIDDALRAFGRGPRRAGRKIGFAAVTDSSTRDFPPRTASYEADPAEVHRVLLLYSGGLDTSVMLKWIQDEYAAEVVCLTVNLGQPGEDYAVIEDKALRLGALECHVVDAREEFAREYVLPAIKANALYGGYPLFTALGRPLIAKLAVDYARKTGCDTIAHGCTGKGNDQVRIEATVATLAPELKVIAPVRSWQMGREEEIAYAHEHGIPIKSSQGTRRRARRTRSTTTSGGAPRRAAGSRISTTRPQDDVFQLVTPPERAPDEARGRRDRVRAGRAGRA